MRARSCARPLVDVVGGFAKNDATTERDKLHLERHALLVLVHPACADFVPVGFVTLAGDVPGHEIRGFGFGCCRGGIACHVKISCGFGLARCAIPKDRHGEGRASCSTREPQRSKGEWSGPCIDGRAACGQESGETNKANQTPNGFIKTPIAP
jgi:hypothetical protein